MRVISKIEFKLENLTNTTLIIIFDKKNQGYKDAKFELEKLVGDSNKYCKNFLLPKEKNKRGFRFFPLMKDIFFRFI